MATFGIDAISTGGGQSIWRSEVITPEHANESKLMVKEIRIPLSQAVSANTAFTITLYADNALVDVEFVVDNSTRFLGKKFIVIRPAVEFVNNFFIQINFTGSTLTTIGLPITGVIQIN